MPASVLQSLDYGSPAGRADQYLNYSRRKKALLIGINYFRQRGRIERGIMDVTNMSKFLRQVFGYHQDDIVILTDDQRSSISQPTKRNILCAVHWLVKDTRPEDSVFFHYSGSMSRRRQ